MLRLLSAGAPRAPKALRPSSRAVGGSPRRAGGEQDVHLGQQQHRAHEQQPQVQGLGLSGGSVAVDSPDGMPVPIFLP